MSAETALLSILTEKIKNDTLVLPTLPAIAIQVRNKADDPGVNLNQMSEVIARDPSLSARMLKIANSAYLGRRVKVNSLTQAVTRIGLNQIKNMATALAMEQLFVSKNELVKARMQQVWNDTIQVVANAMAAMQACAETNKLRHLSMDTMTLSALMYNIGALPILTEAERHKDVFANATFLDAAFNKLGGKIGGKIMQSWGFDDDITQVVEHWRRFSVRPEQIAYLDFVRIGAAKAGLLGDAEEAIYQLAISRGALQSIEQLDAPAFVEMRDNALQIFA